MRKVRMGRKWHPDFFNQIHKKVTILRLVLALKVYFHRFPLIFSFVLRIIEVGKSLLSIFQKGGAKSC